MEPNDGFFTKSEHTGTGNAFDVYRTLRTHLIALEMLPMRGICKKNQIKLAEYKYFLKDQISHIEKTIPLYSIPPITEKYCKPSEYVFRKIQTHLD